MKNLFRNLVDVLQNFNTVSENAECAMKLNSGNRKVEYSIFYNRFDC